MTIRSFFQTLLAIFGILLFTSPEKALGRIHRAPIILKAKDINKAARYPLRFYRLYSSNYKGEAKAVPFQIDEVNGFGDYVLDQGKNHNNKTSNGYFDGLDELSFMGDDVGARRPPKVWPDGQKPHIVFEIAIKNPNAQGYKEGAVYLGLFFSKPPPLENKKYVVFDIARDTVNTSRYEYVFDRKNYLVVKSIDSKDKQNKKVRLIDSSTFFMNADLKYFLTVSANHRSVNSKLEAYKTGPVRTIVRVEFVYSFLNIDFEVGMYTEVSFFSNSVILPAVIQNPIDGINRLNEGSSFYYGFALKENPKDFKFETNMESAISVEKSFFSFLKETPKQPKIYWASLIGQDSMMYVELRPSPTMLEEENVPKIFLDNKGSGDMKKRDNNKVLPLLESPVNMALSFDLTKFSEGEHKMAFQLFFENKRDERIINSFKSLEDWTVQLNRI